jgi:DNA polymerase-3 subunit alpha
LNGKFQSINDFLNRVNPKDMNKLQLEGLVKAGAFDSMNTNRQSLFDSIPNFITKTKNIFENKSTNQIDLFSEDENLENDIINEVDDWKFEERLSKEFEAVGFFISDHPLNQFTEIFDDYKIIEYSNFNSNDETREANIAATLLKVQERKTAKGNSYAVLKLTDLSSVFELFIFSDILELNRETLKEGSSLLLTLVKSISNDENRFKRVNVQKIGSLIDLFNSPIKEVSFDVNNDENLETISRVLVEDGKTEVNFNMNLKDKTLKFKLKKTRNLDRKSLNLLRKREISSTII